MNKSLLKQRQRTLGKIRTAKGLQSRANELGIKLPQYKSIKDEQTRLNKQRDFISKKYDVKLKTTKPKTTKPKATVSTPKVKTNRVKQTIDKNYVNQHGVTFTGSEKEKFRQLVNRAKRKANRLAKDDVFGILLGVKDNYKGERIQSDEFESMTAMLKASTSLSNFKSYREYEKAVRYMEKFTDRGYEKYRLNLLRGNLHKALTETSKYTAMSDSEQVQIANTFQNMSDYQLVNFFSAQDDIFKMVYNESFEDVMDNLQEFYDMVDEIKRL